MNTAANNLENDHIYILRLTDVMKQLTSQEIPEIGHLKEVVDLIRNFADGMHHMKEENHLFPSMVSKGLPKEHGPVAVMLYEHEQGRQFVRGMVENIALYEQGNLSARDQIYKNMTGYAELLRNHIHKENNILFPMADNLFSQSENQNLLTEFDRIENPSEGVNHQVFIERIDRLAEIYL